MVGEFGGRICGDTCPDGCFFDYGEYGLYSCVSKKTAQGAPIFAIDDNNMLTRRDKQDVDNLCNYYYYNVKEL